jgi:hypothetical protein
MSTKCQHSLVAQTRTGSISFGARAHPVLLRSIAFVTACALACGDPGYVAQSYPIVLVGRWVRQDATGAWVDTLEFRANGTVIGSTNFHVPANARWVVKTRFNGASRFCASDSTGSSCHSYVATDSLLTLVDPDGKANFRRVR